MSATQFPRSRLRWPRDRMLGAIAATAIGTGAFMLTIALGWFSTAPLAPLLWFPPLTNGFLVLVCFCVAFLAFGRWRVLRDPVSFWVALAFSECAVFYVFGALTFPGLLPDNRQILGHLGNTAAWLNQLAAQILAPLLIVAALARWPGEHSLQGWRERVVAPLWMTGITLLNFVVVLFEDHLPALSVGNRFTTVWFPVSFGGVGTEVLIGAVLSTRRYLRSRDSLLGYVGIYQIVLFAIVFMTYFVKARFDVLWYLQRIAWIAGLLVMFFGLLSEYVGLFRRERDQAVGLRESQESLRIAHQAAAMGAFEWDLTGDRLRWTRELETLHGLTAEAFEGDWTKYIHPADVSEFERHLAEAKRTGSFEAEWRAVLPDGSLRWLATRGQVIADGGGQPMRMIGVSFDVSDRKRAEEALALEQTLRFKNEFLATISHELRTPLTLILAPLRELRAEGKAGQNLSEEQQQALRVIERNARTLLKTVNDLLDLSRLDAGRLRAEYAKTDLAWLARFVASHFETVAGDRHIRLPVETPETLPAEVDPEKVERVLFNLLANAMKFTPDGGTVRLRLSPKEQAAVLLVEDSGPGIPSEMREAVFERFRQLEGGATRRYGGTGLGLAIVKEFVELHHGKVAVDDAPSGGARFTVEIPLHAPAGSEVKEAPPPIDEDGAQTAVAELKSAADQPARVGETEAPEAPLVLVVEDNPEMNAFVANSLRPRYRVATAHDGQEGLDEALRLRPDLIISDIMMPRRSGEELVREVRRHRDLEDVPILLLSARADEESRIRLLSSGAQDYLIKPFVTQELLARAAGLVQRKREAERKLRENYALLQEAHAQLQEGSRRKDEFLAMLSHELRNPLAAITSALWVLQQRGSVDPSASRLHDLAGRQLGHLRRLLDDLLDVARITQGKVTLEKKPTTLASIVESAIEGTEPLFRERKHHLSVSLPEAPLRLEADPVRLAQALGNLLDNAARYSPDGGEIHVSADSEEDQAVVRVRDNGAGIAPEVLPHIFDLFVQGERSLDRKEGGLGVGLTVTRTVVDLHGGHVEAHSQGPGKGSEFVMRLPLAEIPDLKSKAPTTGTSLQAHKRVLVVDDNADTCETLTAVLQIEGHEVTEARSGPDALEKASRSQPDVALVDIGMPGMDGYEVARRMRRDAALSRTVLVALTGYGSDEDKERAQASGFDFHLTKPVDMDALLRLLSDSRAGPPARPPRR